ncbi:hypothetical protein [Kamptonema sp. UHCC 0994]|uniref:hypothetical protein n=1 Tax=Kamptonema sp. UHCC 0994 TaxID=3031329 RepID=UPI0023B9C724|nr:hypothetical protein [Kamptonema sp. UHCC 0994]MDF0555080.1 hypothetical protein [Kamptonema sp. UHCC 0994]
MDEEQCSEVYDQIRQQLLNLELNTLVESVEGMIQEEKIVELSESRRGGKRLRTERYSEKEKLLFLLEALEVTAKRIDMSTALFQSLGRQEIQSIEFIEDGNNESRPILYYPRDDASRFDSSILRNKDDILKLIIMLRNEIINY